MRNECFGNVFRVLGSPAVLKKQNQGCLAGKSLGIYVRMVQQYLEECYWPSDQRYKGLTGEGLSKAQQLSLWRTDADLASIRDPASLASLPAAEQDSWRAFWSGVDHVLSRTPALVSETAWRGTLTDRTLERRVDLKLLAGQACEIRLFSTAFRPEIQLTDSKGKPLGKSAPAAGTVSTLAFAAPGTETIRTMATSQQQRGTGAYVLTVRVFADKAN